MTVLVGLKAKPGSHEDVLAAVERMLPETREFDGCLGAEALRDLDDPDAVVVLERWRDTESQAAYSRRRAEEGAFARNLGALVDGPPTLRRLAR